MKKILSYVLSILILLPSVATNPVNATILSDTVYVSADGSVDGFDGAVYTTVDAALSALDEGGGTIYIDGNAVLPVSPDLSRFDGNTITFAGCNNVASGNVIEFANATKSFIPTGNATIVFDNITVKHQDGSTTEDWIFPSGGSITFGENCLYEHGYRADRNLDLKMHIGSYYAANGGTINFNAEKVEYVDIGALCGWFPDTSLTFTTTGDITYNFNAGKIENLYGGIRNTTTGYATLNGDVYYNFNGADLSNSSNFALGNYSNGIVNGNIIYTFNGGKTNRSLRIGSVASFTDSYTSYGNLVAIINSDSIKKGDKTFTLNITDGKMPENHGKLFLIINNAEDIESNNKASVTVTSTNIDYYLSVTDGKLLPVFEKSSGGNIGKFLGFEAKSDANGHVPAIGGTVLTKNAAGYYDIPSSGSLTEVSFIKGKNNAVYVSTNGSIDGFDGTVYATIDAALSALDAGGGTIYIDGNAVLPVSPDISKFNGNTITFAGCNNVATGNVIEFTNATKSFVPTGNAAIVFDNITVKHQDGSKTEDWIFPSGCVITFGSGCLYQHGYRADRDLDLKMHIGSYYAANGGTINFNAEKVEYADLGAIAGWVVGTKNNFTTTGDIVYNFNAGIFENIFGGMRNSTTGYATLNGDVYYNFNGATLPSGKNLATGNVVNGIINGNIFFNFNGGDISRTLTLGGTNSFTEEFTRYGNMVVSVNGNNIALSDKAFTLNVADGHLPKNCGDIFFIVNHADKLTQKNNASVNVKAKELDYYILCNAGTVTPVFENSEGGIVGDFLGFDIESDTNGLVPAIFGKKLEKNANGYYHIDCSASVQIVEFAKEQDLIATITLASGLSDQTDITFTHSKGIPFVLPECNFSPESGMMFACWKANGKDYFPGDTVTVTEDTTFTSVYTRENAPYVFYVDTSNGNDLNDGIKLQTAFKTISRAVEAVNTSNITEGRINIKETAEYKNIPAHSKTITFVGGKIESASAIILSGNTVFDRVSVSSVTVYTAGNIVRFTENSENVTDIKLVVSHRDKNSSGNGAILDGGSFSSVMLSEETDTENTLLSIGEACSIKRLVLGSTGGKVSDIYVSLASANISVWSTGDTSASENILFYLPVKNEKIWFRLNKDDFNAKNFIHVENTTENIIVLSHNGIFKTPDDKNLYAMNGEHAFYSVGGEMSITADGSYEIRETQGSGSNYFPYPEIPDGVYFDRWEKVRDGYERALFTTEEKLLSYYVSENGNDTNLGTSVAVPFKTLTAAVNAHKGNDGKIVIMDTVYWSESSTVCLVPTHSGTITFEGLSEDNIDGQIIDYSSNVSVNSQTASLMLQGNSIFKNISFRAHHSKSMYTNGYNLRLEGKIGYIPGTIPAPNYTLTVGKYSASAENADVYLGAELYIDNLYIGHNRNSEITGNTRVIIDGTDVGNLMLCGKGAKLNNVAIVYMTGSVASFSTPATDSATVTGNLTLIKGNGATLLLDNKANIAPSAVYEYNCDAGIILSPVGNDNTLFKVLSDVTIKAQNISTNEIYYSSKGGYFGLPVSSYDITASSADFYTNDGNTITIIKDIALMFDESLYREKHDGIFAGWCYEGENYGPSSGEMLAAGTVLKSNYVQYDPSGDEFGIIGMQMRIANADVSQGLRYIINKKDSIDKKLNIVEYGAVILPSNVLGSSELLIGQEYIYNEKTYQSGQIKAQNIFDTYEGGLRYTLCLVDIIPKNYNNFYTCRAYAICKNANGGTFTLYSAPVASSLINITRNNEPVSEADRAVFEETVQTWKNTYFGEGITPVNNSKYANAYTVNSNGVSVREITIDSGNKNEKPVQIAMITDAHLYSGAPGHTEALDKAMLCASFADQTVLCGDNVESSSSSADIELLKTHVWDVYPNTIAALGNHEYFYPNSFTTDELKAKIDALWPHNPDYYSRLIGNKVLVVVADNARQIKFGESVYYFTEEKCTMLERDITYARENGYTILFFCHVGLSNLDRSLMANERMYELITSNADVIKGCFSGHGHEDNTAALSATYLDKNGNSISSTIPYYWLRGCAEDNNQGHVLYINVE